MRIYTLSSPRGHDAVAPEVPGTWFLAASPEEAVAGCRLLAAQDLEAYTRYGAPLPVSPGEVVLPSWQEGGPAIFAEDFVPLATDQVRAVVRRIDEVRHELRELLTRLPEEAWSLNRPGKWSVRTLVDHVANSQWLIAQALDDWPPTPEEAHASAMEELLAAVEPWVEAPEQPRTDHFGHNSENGRVRWTPRKVLRVVATMQVAWREHLRSGAPAPTFPLAHEDLPEDAAPPSPAEVDAVAENAVDLSASADPKALGVLARRYRYYARRLHVWPEGVLERWDATWEHSKALFLASSAADLARVRVDPSGSLTTVRQALSLSLGHLREHAGHVRRTLALHGVAVGVG